MENCKRRALTVEAEEAFKVQEEKASSQGTCRIAAVSVIHGCEEDNQIHSAF